MQVSLETTEGLGRKLTVGLPADEINTAVEERLLSLRKTARLNGFRPGKVPMQVLRKRYEPQVRSEVLGQLINRTYFEAVREQNLKPAGDPTIEADESVADDDIGFSYTASFEVFPEFEPSFDSAIAVERPIIQIEEQDIDNTLQSIREQRTEYQPVERAAQSGDEVVIDFVGRLEGESEPFEGGTAEGVELELGSGRMIPGFEDQITGMSARDARTIQIEFPADYQAEHLAGRKAAFDVTMAEVREKTMPDMDEDFVKALGVESGVMDDLRADVRKNMQLELDRRIENTVREQIFQGLSEQNPIDVPKALIERQIAAKKEEFARQLPAGFDVDQLDDSMFAAEAEKAVRLGLVVGELVRKHEIKADEEAVRARLEQMAASYESPQEIIDYYYSNEQLMEQIGAVVIEQKVADMVLEAATVTDKTMSFDELMRPQPAPEEAEAAEAAEPA